MVAPLSRDNVSTPRGPFMADAQNEFDENVRSFNSDYLELLRKAAGGDHRWLVTAFEALQDQYEAILVRHDRSNLAFRVPLYPLTFRGNEQFFRDLGFSTDDIAAICRFLDTYREVVGRDLGVFEWGS
jgi:hypothetical protein